MDITIKSLEEKIKEMEKREKELVIERDKVYNELMKIKKKYHTKKIYFEIDEMKEKYEYGISIANEIEKIRKEIREIKKKIYSIS